MVLPHLVNWEESVDEHPAGSWQAAGETPPGTLHLTRNSAEKAGMQVLAPGLVGVPDQRAKPKSIPDPIRVLVVDDNPQDARTIATLLEDGPYSCATVSSYEVGLDVIRRQAHDAYLIDYRLGNRTGLELIREISDGASGPLILITGLDDPELDGLALAAGASDYLSKARLTADDVTRSIRYAVETWKARRSAEAERERFRAIYEGVPIGICRLTAGGVFTEANQFLTNLFGYPGGMSVIGTLLADLLDDPGQADIILANTAAASDQSFPFELEMKRHDGAQVWVGGVLRARRAADRELLGFEGAIGDITARKEAETQVAIQSAILDQIGSAVVMADMSGQVTFWNQHAEYLFGWSPEEAVGQQIGELLAPATSSEETAEIMRVIGETGHWEGEYEAVKRDGSMIPLFVTDTVIADAQGDPLGIVGISTDITERVAAERALRESQELFKEIFEGSPVAKALFEVPSGQIVSVNRAMANFLGYPVERFVGVNRLDFTHPDDLASELDLFGQLMAGEITTYEVEKKYDTAQGTLKWGLVRISLIAHDQDGPGLGMTHIVDITERKEAEAEIRFQASLLDQVQNSVIAMDLNNLVIYWNRYAERLFGWSADEVMGRNPFTITARPNGDPAEFATEIAAALAKEGKWEGEIVLFRKDGSSFPAWSSNALLRDLKGVPIGVVGINVDLTQQKKSQVEVQRQGELARSVLGALPYPQMVISFEGLILAINRAGVAVLERLGELGENGGFGADYVDMCRRHGPEGLGDGVESVLDGTATIYGQEFQLQVDGTTRWYRMEVNPVPGTGAVVARWDITKEHNARGALEDLIRSKDEFIASVSHELRTPLTAVVGLTHELSEGRVRADEVPELQSLIAQQAQEVSDIVEDLLVAARANADTITVRPSPFNIRTEVELVVRPWLRGGAHSIDLSLVDQHLICRGDSGRVRQIMRNLVANAVRYGGKRVAIETCSDGQTVTVTVRDNGAGIPPDAVERMFEPYARLGGITGLPSSVGLGLYVSRLLARMMQGDLKYQRNEGVTEFYLTLPAERRKAQVAGVASGRVSDRQEPPSQRSG